MTSVEVFVFVHSKEYSLASLAWYYTVATSYINEDYILLYHGHVTCDQSQARIEVVYMTYCAASMQ